MRAAGTLTLKYGELTLQSLKAIAWSTVTPTLQLIFYLHFIQNCWNYYIVENKADLKTMYHGVDTVYALSFKLDNDFQADSRNFDL